MANRKFTDEKEKNIAQEYLSGCSTRSLANKYGTSHNTIASALRRTGTKQRDVSERNRLYSIDKHSFDDIDSEEKAYWWGFLYADGSVGREKTVSLKLAYKDVSHIKKLKSFLKSEHPIKIYDNYVLEKKYISASFNPTEKHLAKRLISLGVTTNRGNFHLVTDNLPEHLICHWVRGFFDGDGTISLPSADRITFSICGREEELAFIRNIFHGNIGLRFDQRIKPHKFAKTFYLVYAGGIQCRRIREFMYRDATVFLERKHERFINIPEPTKRLRNKKGQFI